MRTIAIVNQKGGCGKTITSINLSAFLACAQRRVLLVDMDPQGHATLGLLAAAAAPSSRTMYEVFSRRAGKEPTGLREVILSVRENLDVAPADIFLSAIPEMLAGLAGPGAVREGGRRRASPSPRRSLLRNDHQVQHQTRRGGQPRRADRPVLPTLCGIRRLPGAGRRSFAT